MNTLMNRVGRNCIPSSIVDLTLQGADDIGLDLEPILKSAGLPNLRAEWKRCAPCQISRVRFRPVWEEYINTLTSHISIQEGRVPYTQDDDWLLYACIMNGKNLGEVIAAQIRFFNALGERVGKLSLSCSGDEVTFALDMCRKNQTVQAQIVDAVTLSCYHKLFAWLIGKPLEGLKITLVYQPFLDEEILKDIMDFPIRFDAEKNALVFAKEMLRKPIVRTYRELVEAMETMPFELVQLPAESHTAVRLESIIRKALLTRASIPTLEQAADLLDQSARTLHRHLTRENTSFQRVVDKCRMERAIELLDQSHLTIDQIASALGFSESRNFSRVFKIRTGRTPSAYRQTSVGRGSRQLLM